jgi:hypothetical protein
LLLTPKVDAFLQRHKRLLGVMVISKDWPLARSWLSGA